MCCSLESSFFKQNSLLRMFFLHNIKCFCVILGFRLGCGHSVAGHQARDLGQDLGAMQLVISVESVSVERIRNSFSVQGNSNQSLSNRRPET